MIAFILLGILSASTAGLARPSVVTGKRASQSYFNYHVSLEYQGSHFCSGAIVKPNIIITAAHCTYKKNQSEIQVRVGSGRRGRGGKLYQIEEIAEHPDYSDATFRYDVAVIKLLTNVTLSNTVGKISLAKTEPKVDAVAILSGWGNIPEGHSELNYLRYETVTIFNRDYCDERIWFTKEMICAADKNSRVDTCNAESGAPLIANRKLVGIVSWGKGCTRADSPAAYSNVAYLRDWIDNAIRQFTTTDDGSETTNVPGK